MKAVGPFWWDLKKLDEPVWVNEDFWYGITEGYIDPEDFLADPEQIHKVEEAVAVLQSFHDAIKDAGYLPDM